MLEVAIVLPVMLLLLMGTIDLGMALNHYLAVTRATYEGLRYGAGLWDNQPGCKGPECAQADSSNSNLDSIDARVRQILRMKGYTEADVTLRIEQAMSTEGSVTYEYNILKSTVEVPFNAIMPFYKFIPIRTTITFTDLYKDTVSQTQGGYG